MITDVDKKIATGSVVIEPEHVIKPGMKEYERGRRLRERVISAAPYICLERARIVTRAYRETESEHILTRRALAFDRILKGIRRTASSGGYI